MLLANSKSYDPGFAIHRHPRLSISVGDVMFHLTSFEPWDLIEHGCDLVGVLVMWFWYGCDLVL